jgi:hypothetical protein
MSRKAFEAAQSLLSKDRCGRAVQNSQARGGGPVGAHTMEARSLLLEEASAFLETPSDGGVFPSKRRERQRAATHTGTLARLRKQRPIRLNHSLDRAGA